MPLPMYYKIFILLIVVVVASVATIAGAITSPVIGQQNQTSNLTALLTQERNNTFAPGETIVLYVEPVGFGHEQVIEEGDINNNNSNTMLYLMNMTADYGIAAANGTELQLIEDVEVLRNITSHRPNTEMFLTLTITPDVQPLPVGSYLITYSVNDEVSGESFQLKKDIIIAERER